MPQKTAEERERERQQVNEMHRSGMDKKAIAAQLGMTSVSVGMYLSPKTKSRTIKGGRPPKDAAKKTSSAGAGSAHTTQGSAPQQMQQMQHTNTLMQHRTTRPVQGQEAFELLHMEVEFLRKKVQYLESLSRGRPA